MNKVTKNLMSIVLTLALVATTLTMNFAKTEAFGSGEGTVTVAFTVEKFTIGQGFLVEPTLVTLPEGSSMADVFKKVMDERGYTYTAGDDDAFYLESIDNADTGETVIPESIFRLAKTEHGYDLLEDWEENDDTSLDEFDYSMFSGWLFSKNGQSIDTYASDEAVDDGDVIRFQFSLLWGSDIGLGFPEYMGIPNADLADKEALIKKAAYVNSLADKNDETIEAYNKAIEVLENYDALQEDVDAAYQALVEVVGNPADDTTTEEVSTEENTTTKDTAIEKVTEDNTTTEKVTTNDASTEKITTEEVSTASEQASVAPKKGFKVTIKKIAKKKKSAKKIKITIKKVSGATGYQARVYTSKKNAKKNKKAVAKEVVKKNVKSIVIQSKKLKNQKNLFVRVRAYRTKTKNGKKVYGTWSKVKKVVIVK